MIFFRLRAESCYHIRADGAIREYFVDSVNPVKIPLPCVSAAHFLQNPVRTGLDREVYMVADIGMCGHCVEHSIGNVLRIGGGESYSYLWHRGCNLVEQLREIHVFVFV